MTLSQQEILAAVVVVAAIVNWYSRAPGADTGRWLEWLSKPAATIGLIALAVQIEPADGAQHWWFLLGLVLCLGGDVALMWQPELFRTGLVSFLLGHLAFVVGFATRATMAPTWAIAVGAMLLGICLTIGLRHLLPTVRVNAPDLFAPVTAYVVVIGAMAVASWWGGHWAAPLGAASFAVSDLTLADNKFVAARRWSPPAVMITYHLALAFLVLSLR